jgi:CopG family transcriptional regulator/antitoxin EndoAI
MHQRLNISLPDTTVRLLDRVVPKGDRSKFINQAVRTELARTKRGELRRQLEEGYRRRADEDRRAAAEWDHLSAELWARLDREEER